MEFGDLCSSDSVNIGIICDRVTAISILVSPKATWPRLVAKSRHVAQYTCHASPTLMKNMEGLKAVMLQNIPVRVAVALCPNCVVWNYGPFREGIRPPLHVECSIDGWWIYLKRYVHCFSSVSYWPPVSSMDGPICLLHIFYVILYLQAEPICIHILYVHARGNFKCCCTVNGQGTKWFF